MTVFENLQSLIDDANATVLDFQGKLDALAPLLTEGDGEDATPIPLDEYICSIVSQCEDEETEDSTDKRQHKPDSQNPGEKATEQIIVPEEQLQAEIEALKNQMKVVELLRFEIAKMPGKEELIAAVLAHLPEQNRHTNADNPNFMKQKYRADSYD